MEKKPQSLHDVIQRAKSLSEAEVKDERKLDQKGDWMNIGLGADDGKDREVGIPGTKYPLHKALANAERKGKKIEVKETSVLDLTDDDITEEVDDPNTFNPSDWD